ncbi:MAG: hypothetical protein CVU44_21860 [Chloroflexi bacterium HGW-Chloroflexi-6]|nr:MAG: hypothetical protein CVU44_21860 [Chloroflexi bacterium HGW-Chloroflexi-6]
MISISGYQIVKHLKQGSRLLFWRKPGCASCGGKLQKRTFDIPRHVAGELLREAFLGGEAETLFHSTRDDLGWRLRGLACLNCKKFEPLELRHSH